MYCFIFGFQRRVWWPKWTPASSRSLMPTLVATPAVSGAGVGVGVSDKTASFMQPRGDSARPGLSGPSRGSK